MSSSKASEAASASMMAAARMKAYFARMLKLLKIMLGVWAILTVLVLVAGSVMRGCYFRYTTTMPDFQNYDQVMLRADGNYALEATSYKMPKNLDNKGFNPDIPNNPQLSQNQGKDVTIDNDELDANSHDDPYQTMDQNKPTRNSNPNTILPSNASQLDHKPKQQLAQIDESKYGQWLDTGIIIDRNTNIEVTGKISTCTPTIALQKNEAGNTQSAQRKYVPIPRIDVGGKEEDVIFGVFANPEDGKSYLEHATYIPVDYAKKIPEWLNAGVVNLNDEIQFLINIPPKKENQCRQDVVSTVNFGDIYGDCAEGKTVYSPACGIYTPFIGKYVTDCWCDIKYIMNQNVCGPNKNPDIMKKLGINPNDSNQIKKACEDPELWIKTVLLFQFRLAGKAIDWVVSWFSSPTDQPFESVYTVRYKGAETTLDQKIKDVIDEHKKEVARSNAAQNPSNQTTQAKTLYDSNKERDQKIAAVIDGQQKQYIGKTCGQQCTKGVIRDVLPENDPRLRQFWLTSQQASGLVYRFNKTPDDLANSNDAPFHFVQTNFGGSGGIVTSEKITAYWQHSEHDTKRYLQFKMYKPQDSQQSTGGYIVHPRVNSCIAVDGRPISTNYGQVEYILVDEDPNIKNLSGQIALQDTKNQTQAGLSTGIHYTVTLPDKEPQGLVGKKLWLRITNDSSNYTSSAGTYNIKIFKSNLTSDNTIKSNFLTLSLAARVAEVLKAGLDTFKTMTCYDPNYNRENCRDFFTYIRISLMIYVMLFGVGFALGTIQISAYDFVMRLIKTLVVAGLMNGSIFDFFQNDVLDIVASFASEIMCGLGGYKFDLTTGLEDLKKSSNIDAAILTKGLLIVSPADVLLNYLKDIVFADSMMPRFLSLLATGPTAILYFWIMWAALWSFITVIARFVGVILVCGVTMAILIGIAPIFITFILFERTKDLFDNWVNYMWRLMVEPMILGAGIYTLMHLFASYIDKIIGYSVCWKCAIPVYINSLLPIPPILCLNWLVPWGHSPFGDFVKLDFDVLFGMIIIKFCLDGYEGVAKSITTKMAGGMGIQTQMDKIFSEYIGAGANYLKSKVESGNIDFSSDVIG